MDAETATPIACPNCGKWFRASARIAGHQVRCPACGGVLHVPPPPPPTATADDGQPDMVLDSTAYTADPPPPPEPPPTADTVTRFVFHPAPPGGRVAQAGASTTSYRHASRSLRYRVTCIVLIWLLLSVVLIFIDNPDVGLVDPDALHPIINRIRYLVIFLLSLIIFLGFWGGIFMAIARPYKHQPRQVRTRAFYLLWLGPPSLQLLLGLIVWIFAGDSGFFGRPDSQAQVSMIIMSSVASSAPWLIAMYFLAPRITPYLASLATRHVRCRRCRDLHDLIGVWSCSCGYHDYKPRHLLRFRCPLCKAMSGHISCPRCETTILV